MPIDKTHGHLDRRTLVAGALMAAIGPGASRAQGVGARTVFYVAVGATLHLYEVDDAARTLAHGDATPAPAAVQYVWFHPTKPLLYAAYSNRFTSTTDDLHGVAVYAIDPVTGRLSPFGAPTVLTSRPINITLDPAGEYLLVAYNAPSALTVHRLRSDGSIGETVVQREPVEAGIYAHQVRVSPDGKLVVLVTRGNDATPKSAEDPGAFKVFGFRDGQLTGERSVAPGSGTEKGLGFGPRHVDFHPTKPLMLASLERNNELRVYGLEPSGITAEPFFTVATVDIPERKLPEQYVGPIHIHPNGKTVYLANRSDGTVEFAGRKVHSAGENTIVAFALDAATGAPTLLQRIDTQTIHNRTFSIHPNGRMLVAASVAPLAVRDGDQIRTVPAGLSVFAIADDGRLSYIRKYDVAVAGSDQMFWCGMLRL